MMQEMLKSTKTRQEGGVQGQIGHNLGTMAGEISPDMMFCDFLCKMVNDECERIIIDRDECNGV